MLDAGDTAGAPPDVVPPLKSLKSSEGRRREHSTIQCGDSRGRSTPGVEASGGVGVVRGEEVVESSSLAEGTACAKVW